MTTDWSYSSSLALPDASLFRSSSSAYVTAAPVTLARSCTTVFTHSPRGYLPPDRQVKLDSIQVAAFANYDFFCIMPVAVSGGVPEGRDFGRVSFNGLSEPCAVGSIVEVVISAHNTAPEQHKGGVLVEAHGPTGRIYKCPVIQRGSTYTANFTPQDVGDWRIAILYDGEHIRGSPFLCQVYDANLVQVYGLDVGVVGQELKFNVNTSQAGRGDIKVQTYHHGRSIPSYLDRVSPTLYKVKFTPDGAGQYKIHVYFNTMEVKGSPFILDIVDASSVSVYGDNLRMACVDKLATFMIHAVGADSKDLTVTVTAPSGKKKRARITPIGDSVYQVEWKPVEAGEHYIDVRLYGQSVADSPFSCNVGDPDLVTVRNMPSKLRHDELGDPHTFEIDATVAGSGNLEIMINGGRIHCNVREIGSRLYLASFTPTQPVTHVIEMKFNGEPVKHSPWRIEIILPSGSTESSMTTTSTSGAFTLGGMGNVILAPINLAQLQSGMYPGYVPNYFPQGSTSTTGGATTTTISSEVERTTLQGADYGSAYSQSPRATPIWAEIHGRGLQQAGVGKTANFEIGAGGSLKRDDIDVKILSPNMKEIPCQVYATGSGTYVCEYVPTEVGTHRIDLSLTGQVVKGSPFLVSTYSPNKVTIEPIPGGAVGQPVQFIVDANQAGKGQLEISVNQGRVPNGVQMQGSGRCLVTFIPEYSGTYVIDVTFNGDLVLGCPVRVEVFDDTNGTPQKFYSTNKDSSLLSGGAPYHGFSTPEQSKPLSSSYAYERKEYSSSTFGEDGSRYPPYKSTVAESTVKHRDGSFDRTPPSLASKSYNLPRIQKPLTENLPTRYSFENNKDKQFGEQGIGSLHYDRSDTYNETYELPSTAKGPTVSSAIRTPPSTPADDHALPSSFKWREKATEKTAKDDSIRFVSSGTHPSDFDTRASLAGSERYNEKDEMEERMAVRKSELIGGTSAYDREPAATSHDQRPYYRVSHPQPEGGLSECSYSQPKPLSDDDRFGGTTVASYGNGNADRATDQSKNFTYFSTIGPRESTLMSTEIKLTHKNEQERPIEISTVRRQSEDAVKLLDEEVKRKFTDKELPVEKTSSDDQRYDKFLPPSKRQMTEPLEYHLLRKSHEGDNLTEITPLKGTEELSPIRSTSSEFRKPFESTPPKGEILPKTVESPSGKVVDTTFDWSSCKVESPASGVVRISRHGRFEISSFHAPKKELKVNILQPSKTSLDHSIVENVNGLSIDFMPNEVGSHKLHLSLNDQAHPQSPFTFRVYDPDKIHIGAISDGFVGDTIQFTVDATHAGYGNLEIAVMDKDGNIVQSKVTPQEKSSAKFFVSFVPQKSGEYGAQITFNGENLKHSPFKCHISEPPRKEVGAVVATGAAVASTVSHVHDALSKGSAAPSKHVDQQCLVANNGRDFVKNVYPVNKPVSFELEGSAEKLPNIVVKGVNGKEIDTKVLKLNPNVNKVEFVPEVVGDHVIEITQNSTHIPGSPFSCRVYDAKKIKVGEIKHGQLNQDVSFVVDASEAGVGNLEVAVNEGDVSSTAKSLGQHRYEITFIPREPMDHVISVRFNGETVPGSPFICKIVSAGEVDAKGPGLEKVAVNRLTHFIVDTKYSSRTPPTAIIRDPSGSEIPVKISAIYENKFRVEYTPEIVGNYSVNVRYNNEPIRESPFLVKSYDSSKVKLLPVQGSTVGEPASFFIDATKAGAGNMEIIVSVDNRNVPNYVKHEENARFTVSFNPQEPKPHIVSVKFNGDHVPGSPMTSAAFRTSRAPPPLLGDGLQQAIVGSPASFFVRTTSHGGECNVIVTDPQGGAVPVRCYQQKDGNYRVEYTPAVAGDHKIDVSFGDELPEKPIIARCIDPSKLKLTTELKSVPLNREVSLTVNRRGAGKGALSAYLVDRTSGTKVPVDVKAVTEDETEIKFVPTTPGQQELHVALDGVEPSAPILFMVDELGKPNAHGEGLQRSLVNEQTHFVVDSKKIKGDLKVEVINPHGKAVKTAKNKKGDGLFEIIYTPNEIGFYTISLSWNNKPISGSPYSVAVVDPRKMVVKGSADGDKRVLSPAVVGVRKEIKLDTTLAGPGRVKADVRGPAGKVPVTAVETSPGQYTVSFTPNVQGQFEVTLFLADYLLPQGAYKCQANEIGAADSMTTGGGVLLYEANFPTSGLSNVEIERHQQLFLEVPTTPDRFQGSSHDASFTSPKEHAVSPPGVILAPDAAFGLIDSDSSKVTLTGDGFKTAKTNEEAEFFIDGSLAGPGSPNCIMTGQKADVPVSIASVGNNIWRASYTPFVTGTYNLNITWEKKPVKGSPFKVNVLSSADAGKVVVNAEPLPTGIIGQDLKTTIDTRRSGPGELTAQCVGPNKIAFCDLHDQKDGTYLLTIKAQEVGKHTLVVKYNGEHVSGSPFTVYFSTVPDPSKVVVQGPGIEHGILSNYKSNFVVDTKGAGAGQLTVRMRGPKGAFHVEMDRDRKNGRLINCKYDPKEPGDYEIEVKWAGEHVPGSPFLVMIFDTQQELERYLAGHPVSGAAGMTPFLPPGWMGPPPPGVLFAPSPPTVGPGPPPGALVPVRGPPPQFMGPGPRFPPSPRMPFGISPPPPPPGALMPYGAAPRRFVAQNGY